MPAPPPTHPWAYTRAQRIGLLALIAAIGTGYLLADYWSNRPEPAAVDDAPLLAAAERLRAYRQPTVVEEDPESFPFEPNTVSADDLQRLGLSEKQATAFVRYRRKVTFRRPEDIRRLRVLRPAQAEHLVGLARFPVTQPSGSAASPVALPAQAFPFDPNVLPPDSLRLLGLSEREVKALVRYRGYRAVTFRRPGDLARVRALDSAKVAALLPWVSLPDSLNRPPPAPRRPDLPPAAVTVDINRAAAADWQRLPGIGATRAERIVRYRERLGGFATIAQVAETYGLPDSTFRRIAGQLTASPIRRPLRINRATAEELAAHPYFPRTTAVIVVRYRDNHGPFASAEELKNVRALTTETLDKLLPYLNFEP